MIKVAEITKSFNGIKVLDDISIEIKDQEILVVLGESGTGKSVFLKHLIGLLKPEHGVIDFDGEDIVKFSEKKLLDFRKHVGYLFQEGALYDFMNVFENIAFPLKEHTKFSEKEIENKVRDILDIVDLRGVEEKFPSELSGGMKKRVGLARSVILDCKLLLCDEPTSGLDPIRSRDITDLIKQVSRKMKCTTVITSHDIENSFRVADRVAMVRNGKFIIVGTPAELQNSNDLFVKDFIS